MLQVIASRVKKAIAAEVALDGNAADIGSDGRHRYFTFCNRRSRRHVQLPLRASRYLSELWACVVCPDLVFHVFSPEGARIYMHELIRVRDASCGIRYGSWSPQDAGSRAK